MTDDRHVMTIGIDPGQSVGIAALLDYSKLWVAQFRLDDVGIKRVDDAVLGLIDLAEEKNYRLLMGCERFVTNRRTSRLSHQPEAQTVAGRVEALAPDGVEVVRQSVSDAHRFAPDKRLRQLGLYTTPREVDQPDSNDVNSAMRQALLLLARKANRKYIELLRTRGLAPIP